jgi:hypothetical protein
MLAAGIGVGIVLVGGVIILRPAPPASEKTVQPASEIPQQRSPATAAQSSTKETTRIPDRTVAPSKTAAQPQHESVQPPTASPEAAIKPAPDSGVRTDTASAAVRPQGELQPKLVVTPPPPTPSVTATAADARAVASEFLTWCNHRQWRDVERLPSLEGSAELRTELIRLIRSAPDLQAGFERLASRPVLADRTFTTDFVLDLEWRGGQRQLQVTVSAELSSGSWHLAGFGVHPPD